MDASYIWALIAILASVRNFIPEQWYQFFYSIFAHYYEKFTLYHYIEIEDKADSGIGDLNDLYECASLYVAQLTKKGSAVTLRASCKGQESTKISLNLSPSSHVYDHYNGAEIHWSYSVTEPDNQMYCRVIYRCYTIRVLRRDKNRVLPMYIHHVLAQGRLLQSQKELKNIYTNRDGYWQRGDYSPPSTMNTIAMDFEVKSSLISDLQSFMNGKEFCHRVGRAWKRGYLLYGPPGTGKSSLIGAICNFTGYDVYDLELTKVEDNTELRSLLVEVGSRSIIVVEDIDCSLSLQNRIEDNDNSATDNKEDKKGDKKEVQSKVTLSGMLNFLDGLWSSCGTERIFIFTTNYIDRLDPALTRPGRMDMHIHMSYCSFSMFKVLAFNYLKLDEHCLFEKINELLGTVKVTAAQITEVLFRYHRDPDVSLLKVIEMLNHIRSSSDELVSLQASEEDSGESIKKYSSDSSVNFSDESAHEGECK